MTGYSKYIFHRTVTDQEMATTNQKDILIPAGKKVSCVEKLIIGTPVPRTKTTPNNFFVK